MSWKAIIEGTRVPKLVDRGFDYPSRWKHFYSGGLRWYQIGDHAAPGVTSVLAHTKDDTGLKAWRNRVGDEEADRVTKESTWIGTYMHHCIECAVKRETPKPPKDELQQLGARMAGEIIARGLRQVSEVWSVEATLFYPRLYAGTTDMVGVWNGKEAIIDFKSANKPKSEKHGHLDDYFCQAAAYAMAHNRLFGTNIETAVIFMCTRDLVFLDYVLEGRKFLDYVGYLHDRVEAFLQWHGMLEEPEDEAQVDRGEAGVDTDVPGDEVMTCRTVGN